MKKRLLTISLLTLCVLAGLFVLTKPACITRTTPAAVASKNPPILLVHGFNQSSDFWDDIHLIQSLAAQNYIMLGDISPNPDSPTHIQIKSPSTTTLTLGQSACYKLKLPQNGTSDIRDSAILLENAIAHIRACHGSDKILLISFSAGGIVCRQYLTNHLYDHHVESLITVSAPHLGSEHAWLADGYHTITTQLAAMQSDHSGNFVTRKSRKAATYIVEKLTTQIRKWGNQAGIDIDSKAARMLVTPENGNYLASLAHAPHPSDVHYHCIISEQNILNYGWDKLKTDFKRLKKGNFSQMDLSTDLLDLARNALGNLGNLSQITNLKQGLALLKFRGDGVVSKFSQNLNNIAAFKQSDQLKATTTQLETSHGGPEINNAILNALALHAQ